MSRIRASAVFLTICCLGFGQQQPRGVRVRSVPADYGARVTVAGITYAASLIPADEVKHLFAFDISKTYLVFEVALYPRIGSEFDLNPDSFVVRSNQTGDPVRRADSATVAAVIQQRNLPPPNGPVEASAEIGYESGRDPVTGQRVHGVYTGSRIGVTDDRTPRLPSPGGYPQDRALLDDQLWDKGLPQGSIRQATAGYLYYPRSLLKKASNGLYELEYLGSEDRPILNGRGSSEAIQLRVPVKRK